MFLEYPTDITREKGVALTTAWSNADHPIVAASFANGEVDFFLEEGERIDEDDEQAPPSSVQRAGCKTHCMEWSPRVPILASGWDDGMVCTWTEKEGQLRECGSRLHKVAVTLVCWSPDGSRLITGDSSGKIGVWQSDQRGRLMLVCQYARSGAIKYCVFRAGITIPGEVCPAKFNYQPLF
jgi:WD40 repeat protein